MKFWSVVLGCIDIYWRAALREKIRPDEAEPEGCGGPTVEGENEVWPDFRRNPKGRGHFSPFRRRSSLADTRYASLLAPRTEKKWLPALPASICRYTLGCAGLLAAASLHAQTPVLGSIETPHANMPTTVHVAGGVYGPGAVAYGPAGTPLVLSGSDFGDSGTVQFIAYKNGVLDTNNSPVAATVTLWTPTFLFLTVPSGALTGKVLVKSTGGTSNGLPFVVTNGSYSNSCPALPSQNQLQITTTSLDDGMVGQAYSMSLSASGGAQSYTWSIVSGSLPVGLSLNASTGVISGTPTTTANQTDITFQVTDSGSPHQITTAVLSLTVTGTGVPAVLYSYCIAASSGSGCATPTGGYDAVGNILAYTDSVTGTWSMTTASGASGYDALNRLVAAQATAGSAYQGLQATWAYDDFGNRTSENFGGTLGQNNTAPIPPSSTIVPTASNRIQTLQSGSSSSNAPLRCVGRRHVRQL